MIWVSEKVKLVIGI